MRKLLRRIRDWAAGPDGQRDADWVEARHHHLDEKTGRVVTTPFKIDRGARRE